MLFNLGLSEDTVQCSRMLYEWTTAFDIQIPTVVMTDGDESIHPSLASLPYYDSINHLLCVFHIFDLNVKKHTQPSLQMNNGPHSWPQFRHALDICREAGSESNLTTLWNELLEEWFGENEGCSNAIQYLNTYVWSKRRQWATLFFQTAFTLGHSTNQRAEVWNKLVKIFRNSTSLVHLTKKIHFLVKRQSMEVARSTDEPAYRVSPFGNNVSFLSSIIANIALSEGISRYCSAEMNLKLQTSFTFMVCKDSINTLEDGNTFTIMCMTTNTYDKENSCPTNVSISFKKMSVRLGIV